MPQRAFLEGNINDKGLKYYGSDDDYLQRREVVLIKDISIADIFIDKSQFIWISTANSKKGVFKFNMKALTPTKNLFEQKEITKIISIKRGKVIVIYSDGELHELDLIKQKKKKYYHENLKNTFKVSYIDGKLYIIDKAKRVFVFDGGKIKEHVIIDNGVLKVNYANAIVNNIHKKGFLLSGRNYDIMEIDLSSKNPKMEKFIMNSELKIGLEQRERILDLIQFGKSKLLYATPDGLNIVNKGLAMPLNDIPEFNQRFDKLLMKNDGKMVLATKYNGIVITDTTFTSFKSINEKNGLLLNLVNDIFIDKKDRIWVSSNAGFTIIDIKDDKATFLYFTEANGLFNNNVNDVMFYEDKAYFATKSGLQIIDVAQEFEKQNFENTFVSSLLVNGKKIQIDSIINLKHDENNIFIELLKLDFRMNGKIKYKYKVNEGPWQELGFARTINFSNLNRGKYDISYASLGLDQKWSEPHHLLINVLPAWYNTWSFYAFIFCLLSFIIYKIFSNRLSRIQKDNATNQEIYKLEKAALQAQMNPHFIFNSLNSIQKYILTNEKVVASEYLSQFAQLVRLNLKATSSQKILLKEEITLLELYLELEKMRFKEKFEYIIHKADVQYFEDKIEIAPMLIQPLVENAILHGISKLDVKGLIEISMKIVDEEYLFVSVKDNGMGIENKENNTHVSLGSSITKKRLSLLSKELNENFTIKNIIDDANNVVGVEAVIKIKFNKIV